MMKPDNMIHIVIQNMRIRKKHLIVSSLLLIITLLIFLSGFNFNLTLGRFLEDVVYEIPLVRTLYFHLPLDRQNEAIEAINNEVKEGRAIEGNYLHYGIHGLLENEQLSGGLTLNFYNQGYERLISNQGKIDHDDNGKIVLPKFLLLNTAVSNALMDTDQPQFYDGNAYIGKTIEMQFIHSRTQKEITRTFTVIGTYDNSLSFDDTSNALISYSDLVSLSELLGIEHADFSTFYVIAKDFTQIETIKKSLIRQLNLEGDIRAVFNFDTLIVFMVLARFITLFIGTLLVICSSIYISMSTIKNIEHRSIEIGVLKVLGYNSKQIKNLFIFENIIITSVSVIIAFLLHLLSIFTMNLMLHKFGQFQIRNMHFKVYPIIAIVFFLTTYAIVYFLSVWKVKKIDALESIDILKSS